VPGFAKFVVIKKPATKARKGINPFTQERDISRRSPPGRSSGHAGKGCQDPVSWRIEDIDGAARRPEWRVDHVPIPKRLAGPLLIIDVVVVECVGRNPLVVSLPVASWRPVTCISGNRASGDSRHINRTTNCGCTLRAADADRVLHNNTPSTRLPVIRPSSPDRRRLVHVSAPDNTFLSPVARCEVATSVNRPPKPKRDAEWLCASCPRSIEAVRTKRRHIAPISAPRQIRGRSLTNGQRRTRKVCRGYMLKSTHAMASKASPPASESYFPRSGRQ